MHDVLVGAILIALAWLGVRRGFAREVASALSWSGATFAALKLAPALAPRVATLASVAALRGYLGALLAVWVLAYFALWLLFRRLFWPLWRQAPGQSGGAGAKRSGEGGRLGLVERLSRLVDSLFGGAVGLLKGAIVCGVVLYAGDLDIPVVRRAPWWPALYRDWLAPALDALPEVRFARAAGALARARSALAAHPERKERLTEHPELRELAAYEPIARALGDVELRAAVDARRIDDVIESPRLVELLRDPAVLERVAKIDAARVLEDVLRAAPPPWMFPTPPGEGEGAGLEVGDVVTGRVLHVEEYGAVLAVARPGQAPGGGGAVAEAGAPGPTTVGGPPPEGLIRPDDLSWTRTFEHPRQALAIGQEIEVVVLATGAGHRVALGWKQASSDPWDFRIPWRLREGRELEGEVTRVVPGEGVYLLLEGAVEGLLPEASVAAPLPVGGRVAVRVRQVVRSRRVVLLELDPG